MRNDITLNNREEVEKYFFEDIKHVTLEERQERLEYAKYLIKLALEEEKKEAIQ